MQSSQYRVKPCFVSGVIIRVDYMSLFIVVLGLKLVTRAAFDDRIHSSTRKCREIFFFFYISSTLNWLNYNTHWLWKRITLRWRVSHATTWILLSECTRWSLLRRASHLIQQRCPVRVGRPARLRDSLATGRQPQLGAFRDGRRSPCRRAAGTCVLQWPACDSDPATQYKNVCEYTKIEEL